MSLSRRKQQDVSGLSLCVINCSLTITSFCILLRQQHNRGGTPDKQSGKAGCCRPEPDTPETVTHELFFSLPCGWVWGTHSVHPIPQRCDRKPLWKYQSPLPEHKDLRGWQQGTLGELKQLHAQLFTAVLTASASHYSPVQYMILLTQLIYM